MDLARVTATILSQAILSWLIHITMTEIGAEEMYCAKRVILLHCALTEFCHAEVCVNLQRCYPLDTIPIMVVDID